MRPNSFLESLTQDVRSGLSARTRAEPSATLVVALIALAALAWFWWLAPTTRNVMFREGRALDWMSSTFLASAAVSYAVAFLRGRRTAEPRAWIWLIVALGFAFLTFVERFQLHERFGRGDVGGPFGLRNIGDGMLMLYGVAAVIGGMTALRTVVRCPSSRYLVPGFVFFVVHTAADSFMESSGTKLRIEETFKLLAGASFAAAGLVAAYRARPDAARRTPVRSERFALVAGPVALALFVAAFGPGWNASAPSPWGSPAAWLSSVYLGVAALICLPAGPRFDRGHRIEWLAWRELALVLGVAAVMLGVPAWRSIADAVAGMSLSAIYDGLVAWFAVPQFWGGFVAFASALLVAQVGLRSHAAFHGLLTIGLTLLACEVVIGRWPGGDPFAATLARMVGGGCVLTAVLSRIGGPPASASADGT